MAKCLICSENLRNLKVVGNCIKCRISKEALFKLYIDDKKSANEISKIYNVSDTTIGKLLNIYNIPKRTMSCAVTISTTGLKRGKYKISDVTRKIYSDRQVNGFKKGKLKGFLTSRGKIGYREDIGITVRSILEANYCRYLEYLKSNKEILRWEYEAETFYFDEIGCRSYTPDFKVFLNDGSFEYHEVKGDYNERTKKRMNAMAREYPNIKIILIRKEWFKKNNEMLTENIKNLEIHQSVFYKKKGKYKKLKYK